MLLLVALALQALANIALQQWVLKPQFIAYEREAAATDLQRIHSAMRREVEQVNAMARDWANWDDMAAFARGEAPEFAEVNLTEAGSQSSQADWILVFRPDGTLHAELLARAGLALAPQLIALRQSNSAFQQRLIAPALAAPTATFHVSGLVNVGGNPIAVSARAIRTSDESGPVEGAFVMARVLNAIAIQRIAEQTVTTFSLIATEQRWPPDSSESRRNRSGLSVQFRADEHNAFRAQSELEAIIGEPFVMEQRHLMRASTEAAVARWSVAAASTLVTVLLVGSIYLLVVIRSVFRPLREMQQTIAEIRRSNDLERRVALPDVPELQGLAVGFNTLMEKLAQSERTLTELSLTDALTGLANRRGIQARFASEAQHAARGRYPVAILIIDIDHFKRYNDHYGHPAGDTCLRAVALALASTLRRTSDFVGRYGGEEFVVLLPYTAHEGAMQMADDLLAAVRDLMFAHAGSSHGIVTISIGGAVGQPQSAAALDAMFAAADKELYLGKESGRNAARLGEWLGL